MNNWKIPIQLEVEVRKRDISCVYCGTPFSRLEKKKMATWEHIINDETIVTKENIALCCCSCNASKGAKLLSDWLNSKYCIDKNINFQTVAPIVKKYINQI